MIALLACAAFAFAQEHSAKTPPRIAALANPVPRMDVNPAVDRVLPILLEANQLRTIVTLTNLERKSIYFAVSFYDPAGKPLRLPVTGVGAYTGIWGLLQASESTTVETAATSANLQGGYARVHTFDREPTSASAIETADRVAGFGTITYLYEGRTAWEYSLPLDSLSSTQAVVTFDQLNNRKVAVAVTNITTRAASVKLTVLASNGTQLGQQTLSLNPGQQSVVYLWDAHPTSNNKSGTVQVASENGQAISVAGERWSEWGVFSPYPAMATGSTSTLPPTTPPVTPPVTPPTPPPTTPPSTTFQCSDIMGGELYSTGQSTLVFLGTISTSSGSDSLSYTSGSYGSSYGSYSIFNRTGVYGSSVSNYSPWNPTAANPPAVLQRGVQLGFLTYNTAKTPRIDPDMMLRCINRTR